MKESKKMLLRIEEIKNNVLLGLNETEIIFTNIDKLTLAIEKVNRYLEADQLDKMDFEKSYLGAMDIIENWKKEHIAKANEVIKKKEELKAIQLEKTNKALKLIPKLNKAYDELDSVLKDILSLDENVIKNPFGLYSNRRVSNQEIINDFKSLINETLSKASR